MMLESEEIIKKIKENAITDKNITNFGDLVKYIKLRILHPATEELEADDLSIDIYDGEISFQINSLYNGHTATYIKNKGVTISIDDRISTIEMPYEDMEQIVKLAKCLNEHREILDEII